MPINENLAKIEAILFASGESVEISKIKQVLKLNEKEFEACKQSLLEKYSENSGIKFLVLGECLQFASNPNYIEPVREVMDLKRNTPLSSAAMEVLALVAYNQPVTKAFVEQVRGVDCSGVLSSLSQKELIEEAGRLELPGRPLLYKTTTNFLRCFGISDISQLPEFGQSENEEAKKDDE
ncbi:MAG: SMC-Scp complex subunit ScpB [Clostridia bacterium]